MFVRFQSPCPGGRGIHIGVFGLANSLARNGELSPSEWAFWRAGNDWFTAAYADPSDIDPVVYDTAVNPLATAWFKPSATHLIERVSSYLDMLEAHGIVCARVEASDPGRVIYEDEVQIVVVPHEATSAKSFHPTTC